MSDWPTSLDWTTIALFVALVVGLPFLGYICAVLDFMAYLRSLRRALVRVVNYFPRLTHKPDWAQRETPRCLIVFGLSRPCTEEDLMHAYRNQVKRLHPDRGGDKQRFLLLQEYFEEAKQLLRQESS